MTNNIPGVNCHPDHVGSGSEVAAWPAPITALPEIIGVAGTNGSGKDTLAALMAERKKLSAYYRK